MFFKTICLIFGLLSAATSVPVSDRLNNVENSRIVGGTPTTIEQFPYIVSLIYFYPGPSIFVQRCVGSLISSYHVLTTAFCFTGANLNFMLVRAGSTNSLSGGTVTSITHFIKHPSYLESPRQGDVAVSVLISPFIPSSTIGILYLPPQNTYIPDGTALRVVSWGFESEQGPQIANLKEIQLYKLPLTDCQAAYAGNNNVVIDDPVICASASGRGMCLGDSGAPVAINDVVVGLSSFYDSCVDKSRPDVFTRIDRYTDWIMEVAVAPRMGRSLNSTILEIPTPRVQHRISFPTPHLIMSLALK